MHTLQNDILTQIMAKHIRKREYIPIYFALVLVALLFLGRRAWRSGRVCLPWIVLLCGRPGSMWSGCKHPGRGFRGFRSVCVGNGRYLGKCLRSDGLFIAKR